EPYAQHRGAPRAAYAPKAHSRTPQQKYGIDPIGIGVITKCVRSWYNWGGMFITDDLSTGLRHV
ncbi:MAG: hypothetical protein IJ268_01455, partial [Proteobacteria bacterium]|nr:hypothetical protein [Pseudomonadota bacterium]